jgi:hypothetical protein
MWLQKKHCRDRTFGMGRESGITEKPARASLGWLPVTLIRYFSDKCGIKAGIFPFIISLQRNAN